MKMVYRVAVGRTVEVDGATQQDLLRELAGAVEVFGEPCCGLCGETAIVPIARHAQKFEFFEWGCTNPQCGARLSFGVRNDQSGRLFPKRKLDAQGKPDMDHGTAGDHNGWTRYRGDSDTGSAAGPGPRTPPPPTQRGNGGTTAPATTTKPTGKPAAPPADAGARITAEQWSEIQTELRRHFIADRAFLERHGYQSPREILAAHFAEALAAAKAPDDELRAIQKRLKLAER